MIELLCFILGIIQIEALYLLSCKNKNGFSLGLVCSVLWILYVMLAKNSFGLIPISVATIIINIQGYKAWKNEEKQTILPRKEIKTNN